MTAKHEQGGVLLVTKSPNRKSDWLIFMWTKVLANHLTRSESDRLALTLIGLV